MEFCGQPQLIRRNVSIAAKREGDHPAVSPAKLSSRQIVIRMACKTRIKTCSTSGRSATNLRRTSALAAARSIRKGSVPRPRSASQHSNGAGKPVGGQDSRHHAPKRPLFHRQTPVTRRYGHS